MGKISPALAIFALIAVLLAACAESQATTTATPTVTPSPTATPLPTPTPPPTATPVPTSTAVPSQSDTSVLPVAPDAASAAQEVLDASLAAMSAAGSFHFQVDANVKPLGTTSTTGIPLTFTGDFLAPDRVRGKLVVSLSFFSLVIETIAIGDKSYTTNPQTGEWEVGEGPGSLLPNPAELTGGKAAEFLDLALLGQETLDGVPVYHLQGVPPQNIFGGPGAASQADFWIGVDGFRILRISAQGEVPLDELGPALSDLGLSGTARVALTMNFSAYGEPVVIEAPPLP